MNATVQRCTLTTAAWSGTVRAPTAAEAVEIVLGKNGGLSAGGGDLLRIGDPLTRDDELVVTAGFDAPTDPDVPVRVRLRTPLAAFHRVGEPAQAMNASAPTPVGTVRREALPGDAVLFATGLPSLPTASTIVVEAGTPQAVFYRATQYPTTSGGGVFAHLVAVDATGHFVWPPISRVAQVRVLASLPPYAPVQIDMALDYGGDASLAIVLT